MTLSPRPLVAADMGGDDSRFEVRSRLEIISTMRALADRHALVTAYGARAADFIVTAVLAVHANVDVIVFDFGADRGSTDRVLAASDVRFITQLDHIRIQFVASCFGTLTYEGAPAFVARFPDVMLRLQRRESYRIKIPLGRPLELTVTPNPANPEMIVPLRVVDVSCGGVAVSGVPMGIGAAVGVVYRQCRMSLQGLGTITPDLRIVRVTHDETRPGTLRMAGEFVNLPGPATMLLQRYINRVEREQLERA